MLIDEKIFKMVEQKVNARVSRNQGKLRHELRHPGRALDLKTKEFEVLVSFSFSTFLSINLFSNFCAQFQLSVLISSFCTPKMFLQCLGLIDMLSANQHGEIFSCIFFMPI